MDPASQGDVSSLPDRSAPLLCWRRKRSSGRPRGRRRWTARRSPRASSPATRRRRDHALVAVHRRAAAGGRSSSRSPKEKNFRKVVTRKLISTSDDFDHAVKAKITGLDPYEQYYYRFSTMRGNSAAGRFRTALPADSNQPVTFAYFSCQEYSFGYFNAHALLARRTSTSSSTSATTSTTTSTSRPAPALAATPAVGRGRADARRVPRALQGLPLRREPAGDARGVPDDHRLWDDHEVQNNYAGGPSQGGDAAEARNPRPSGTSPTGRSSRHADLRDQREDPRLPQGPFGRHVDLFVPTSASTARRSSARSATRRRSSPTRATSSASRSSSSPRAR